MLLIKLSIPEGNPTPAEMRGPCISASDAGHQWDERLTRTSRKARRRKLPRDGFLIGSLLIKTMKNGRTERAAGGVISWGVSINSALGAWAPKAHLGSPWWPVGSVLRRKHR